MAQYDLLGNISVIRAEDMNKKEKLVLAKKLLERPSAKTVVEKVGDVKGRLRTIDTKHVLGEKNLIVELKENDCRFKFNVEDCYFSPRLSHERGLIAEKIKSKDRVLVMFAGMGVYPIVVYKKNKPKEIVSVELGKECCKWAKENLKLNKIPEGKIEVIQGDVKKKVISEMGKFDVILMPRPNLEDSFIESALKVSKKGTMIYYNGFCNVDGIDELVENLVEEAKNLGRKIKIINVLKAGDIAPYKFRYRIEMKVMN